MLVEISEVPGDADVIDEFTLHPPAGVPRYDDGGRAAPEGVDLGKGIMLGALPGEEIDLILTATELRGHFFRAATSLRPATRRA